jgi:hypothetical protein
MVVGVAVREEGRVVELGWLGVEGVEKRERVRCVDAGAVVRSLRGGDNAWTSQSFNTH